MIEKIRIYRHVFSIAQSQIGVIFSGGKNFPLLNCLKSLDGVSRDENDAFSGLKKVSFIKNHFFLMKE